MSNFYGRAIHPLSRKVEEAEFLDNYYGRHRYGVRFPSDGSIWAEKNVNRPREASAETSGTGGDEQG